MLRFLMTGLFMFVTISYVIVLSEGGFQNAVASRFEFVVASGGAIHSLSEEDIKLLYLGVKKEVNGVSPKLYISRDKMVRKVFFKFLGVDEKKFKKLWLLKALSGEAIPPEGLPTDEIIKRLRMEKNALGIIPKSKAVGLNIVMYLQ